jgi:hypothetical protein
VTIQPFNDLTIQQFLGGHKAVVRPDPIPNSAVKRSVADGSACIACARVGSRQIFLFAGHDKLANSRKLPAGWPAALLEIRNAQHEGNILMKKSIVLTLMTAAMLFTGPATQAAEGAKDKSAQAPKSERKQKQIPFRGKISAVDKTTKTVTLEGKQQSRALQITSGSKITKDGKPAVMDDVIVGQTVGGLAKETAAGKWEIVTLNIGAKGGKPKDAEKKGENR